MNERGVTKRGARASYGVDPVHDGGRRMTRQTDGRCDGRFERLFAAHAGPIYNYLCRLLGDRVQAEDACQDVFLRAYRALPRLPEDANDRAWLYRIATNCATDRYRRGRLIRWLPLVDRDARHAATAEAPVEEAVLEGDIVQRALDALPVAYRRVLVLYSVQGYSVREIAEMLGATEGAVKVQLHRARKRLGAALETENGDGL